jgi:L-lactate dehydrogenase complex protein LldG
VERERFLGRVHAALRGAVLPDGEGPSAAPEIRFDRPVTRFVEQAEAVATVVTRAESSEQVADAIGEVIGDDRTYVGWDDLEAFIPGWDAMANGRGWVRVDATVGTGSRTADLARVGDVKVGITGADVAIAATGTVVLAHGPGRPRAASLLVETHLVLLPVNRIVPSLHDALVAVRDVDTSNVVAITGPSRTGDIESILTLGVHGPRQVHIVLIGGAWIHGLGRRNRRGRAATGSTPSS